MASVVGKSHIGLVDKVGTLIFKLDSGTGECYYRMDRRGNVVICWSICGRKRCSFSLVVFVVFVWQWSGGKWPELQDVLCLFHSRRRMIGIVVAKFYVAVKSGQIDSMSCLRSNRQ